MLAMNTSAAACLLVPGGASQQSFGAVAAHEILTP